MMLPEWLEYHEDPITLHSGGRSHWLVRAELLYKDERVRDMILQRLALVVRGYPEPYIFVPVPTGGNCWAEALANHVGGFVFDSVDASRGSSIFAIDDVVTTGQSIASVASVTACRLAVWDRRWGQNFHIENLWAAIIWPLPLLEKEQYNKQGACIDCGADEAHVHYPDCRYG